MTIPNDEVEEDQALQVLLKINRESGDLVPAALLARVYDLEKKHQFETDRSSSLRALEALVEEETERTLSSDVTK